jgi:cell division septal protein FtsQ
MLFGCAAFVSLDERFFVYEAQIVGADHLDTLSIYQAAGVDKQSIFWIDPNKVAASVERLDGIKEVTVQCGLASSVAIAVEERQPRLLWRLEAQKQDWWLDEEGVVLPYHGDPNSDLTVFVDDFSSRRLEVGDRIRPEGLAASVLQMSASLPGTQVFYYDAERGLSYTQLTADGQWPVYVGASDDLSRKIQVTAVLNDYLKANGIRPTYVDVRWASRPVYGLPSARASGGGN